MPPLCSSLHSRTPSCGIPWQSSGWDSRSHCQDQGSISGWAINIHMYFNQNKQTNKHLYTFVLRLVLVTSNPGKSTPSLLSSHGSAGTPSAALGVGLCSPFSCHGKNLPENEAERGNKKREAEMKKIRTEFLESSWSF